MTNFMPVLPSMHVHTQLVTRMHIAQPDMTLTCADSKERQRRGRERNDWLWLNM